MFEGLLLVSWHHLMLQPTSYFIAAVDGGFEFSIIGDGDFGQRSRYEASNYSLAVGL